MSAPLADRIRPQDLSGIVGQAHLLSKGKILYNIIETGQIPSMIFYGPCGVGKTTVARLIAGKTNRRLFELNGTSASTADIKQIIAQKDTLSAMNGILLYLDEIQYLNKKQQQSLLQHIENGDITLIASTTENPYFYIYGAILSRCTVFEFKAVPPEQMIQAITRAFDVMAQELSVSLDIQAGTAEVIAQSCGGDVRKSMNTVELCVLSAEMITPDTRRITQELAQSISQKSGVLYDRKGDVHYDLLSAMQKSIRGSDPNAAVHYLARLLEAGDLLAPCRRLLVTASEDIGLAYPQAIAIVKACVDTAVQVGLPEARIPLAQATVLLSTAPKSNSAYLAIDLAMADVRNGKGGAFPRHLQNLHFDSAEVQKKGQFYAYPHDAPHHYVEQQYLPDDLKDAVYYTYADNKVERLAKAYWDQIKNNQ